MATPPRARTLPDTVYHSTEASNWPSIQMHGLLPAASLYARSLPPGEAREAVRRQRTAGLTLPSGAVLRDQCPMPERALDTCLVGGLTSADWYEIVNQGSYFWVDPARLERHLGALRGPQMLIEIDGPALAAAYGEHMYLTAFNVGAARRRPARRGHGSFVPLASWQARGWADEDPGPATIRSRSHVPAELVVRAEIPDLHRFIRSTRLVGA